MNHAPLTPSTTNLGGHIDEIRGLFDEIGLWRVPAVLPPFSEKQTAGLICMSTLHTPNSHRQAYPFGAFGGSGGGGDTRGRGPSGPFGPNSDIHAPPSGWCIAEYMVPFESKS